ncbi:UNVERIFIED_CONTAM: hypothetical protein HDU68_003400 [Siphonaria sp. JEL0065]|nr:hypothetical protein HDU68_003400 [Siphonaria sp. JEL0065]
MTTPPLTTWTQDTLAQLGISVEATSFLDIYPGTDDGSRGTAEYCAALAEIAGTHDFRPYRFKEGQYRYTRGGVDVSSPSDSDLINTCWGIFHIMERLQGKSDNELRLHFINGLMDGCDIFPSDAFGAESLVNLEFQLPGAKGPEGIQLHIAYTKPNGAICGFVMVSEDYETGDETDYDLMAAKRFIACQLANVQNGVPEDIIVGVVTNGTAVTVYHSHLDPIFVKNLLAGSQPLPQANIVIHKQCLSPDMDEPLVSALGSSAISELCLKMCKLAGFVEYRITFPEEEEGK